MKTNGLLPYPDSLAGTLLAAREAVMAPIRPMLRDAGVTEQQWRVLRVLNDAGELDPTRLSQLALLHAPSVTRILRELLERGLVTRQTDTADARRSLVTITGEGHVLVEHTARHTKQMIRRYEALFGATRISALRGELAALTKAIEGCVEEDDHR